MLNMFSYLLGCAAIATVLYLFGAGIGVLIARALTRATERKLILLGYRNFDHLSYNEQQEVLSRAGANGVTPERARTLWYRKCFEGDPPDPALSGVTTMTWPVVVGDDDPTQPGR